MEPSLSLETIHLTFLLLIRPPGCLWLAMLDRGNPIERRQIPLRTYELVFVAQPELDEERLNALVERIQQTITTHGGQLVKTESLGRRKLAYPIKKRREGHYVLIHAGLETATIAELERELKLSEDVLRYLLVRLDEVS